MKLVLNIQKRYAYAIIGLLIILVGIFIVNALTPGQTPNPGHSVNELGIPNPCTANQVLSYNGNAWVCKTDDVGSSGATSATISLTNCQWSTPESMMAKCDSFGPDYVQIGHDTGNGGARMFIYCCKLVINLQS